MVNIIKQEIIIKESLKKKLELIYEFSNTTLTIINGSRRKIEKIKKTIALTLSYRLSKKSSTSFSIPSTIFFIFY